MSGLLGASGVGWPVHTYPSVLPGKRMLANTGGIGTSCHHARLLQPWTPHRHAEAVSSQRPFPSEHVGLPGAEVRSVLFNTHFPVDWLVPGRPVSHRCATTNWGEK